MSTIRNAITIKFVGKIISTLASVTFQPTLLDIFYVFLYRESQRGLLDSIPTL